MDSDGSGFFAIGLLFMFITYAIWKFFLDNILFFVIVFVVFIALLFLYDSYGYDLKVKFGTWFQGRVDCILRKYFKVSLNNRIVWSCYYLITAIFQMGIEFLAFIAMLSIVAYVL